MYATLGNVGLSPSSLLSLLLSLIIVVMRSGARLLGLAKYIYYWERKQIGSSVKDRGLSRHVLDFMRAFLHCLSRQNYIQRNQELSTGINVFSLLNQIFVGII